MLPDLTTQFESLPGSLPQGQDTSAKTNLCLPMARQAACFLFRIPSTVRERLVRLPPNGHPVELSLHSPRPTQMRRTLTSAVKHRDVHGADGLGMEVLSLQAGYCSSKTACNPRQRSRTRSSAPGSLPCTSSGTRSRKCSNQVLTVRGTATGVACAPAVQPSHFQRLKFLSP